MFTLYFTATLINLHQRVEGTSSLFERPRQLPSDVATTCDKLISFCRHRRGCLAVILLLLLLMVIILVTLTVYFTHNGGSDVTEHTFPPPEGKSSTLVSVPSSRFLFINPLNAELNPICCLLALLGANHFLHVSRIKVKSLTLRVLMSYIYIYIYIYMEHQFLMFLDHTQRRSTVGRTPLDE